MMRICTWEQKCAMVRRGEIQKTVSPSSWEVRDREREAEEKGWDQDIRSGGDAGIQGRTEESFGPAEAEQLKI